MLTPLLLGAIVLLGVPATPYDLAQLDLELTTASIADLSPEESIVKLRDALAETLRHPTQIAHDGELTERLAKARLALVWAYLAAGDPELAQMTMDLAIRSAGPTPLPIAGLGPEVRKLHDERRKEFESGGTATIEVDCDGCDVVIDEAKSRNPSDPLYLGIHRVWLLDPLGQLEPKFEGVSLDQADATVKLTYRAEPQAAPAPEPTPTRSRAPRWVKFSTMGVGVGMLVIGSVLVSLHHECPGGGTPTAANVDTCPRLLNTMLGGAGLLAAGGAVLLGGTVWLTIDEVRAGKAKHASAMVGWTLRF